MCVSMRAHTHTHTHTCTHTPTCINRMAGLLFCPQEKDISGSYGDLTGDKALHCCDHKRQYTPAYVDNHLLV